MTNFELSSEAQQFRDAVARVATNVVAEHAHDVDVNARFPKESYGALAENGLLGITLPEAQGGQGGSIFEVVLALEQLAGACVSTSMLVMTQNCAGAEWLKRFADDEETQALLAAIRDGKALVALCLSEPEAGSDLASLGTTAVHDGDTLVINGRKAWVTLGSIADEYIILARLSDAPGTDGLGLVRVPSDAPGLSFGAPIEKFAWRGLPQCEVVLEDCRVPAESVLLEEGRFRELMTGFNHERLGNASSSLGIAQTALNEGIKYVLQREQFGKKIADFQGIRWEIADAATDIEATRLMVYRAAASAAASGARLIETSMAKKMANETVRRVAELGYQLHGAAGYTYDYPVQRLLRDGLPFGHGGGTIQIHKNMISSEIFKGRWDPARSAIQET